MSTIVENKFEYFVDLFPEIRTMVVDEMRPEERCRFRRCSKLSDKVAKASKNYIWSLDFYACDEMKMSIYTWHNSDDGYLKKGLVTEFKEDQGNKFIQHSRLDKVELWRKELDKSTDLVEHAADHFKQLLQKYRDRVKRLYFQGSLFNTKLNKFDFGLGSWKNLKELRINGSMTNLLSTIRRPLKNLIVGSGQSEKNLADCVQIYEVRNRILLHRTNLNFEQMLRLSAPSVDIPVGDLTELDIYNFIRRWQMGTLGKEVKRYDWVNVDRSSSFDISKLFRFFEAEYGPQRTEIEVKNFKEAGKIGKMDFYDDHYPTLIFEVYTVQQ